ncbi:MULTISPECIES: DUF3841 domain-containing protein [Bacillus]|uniref:DUF3841 domain-containing protein n=6 Tax=Bacillus cereus group TaxID=86661 RepID=A0AAC8SHL6_BACAN|nr:MULTISPECIES: DUF3841 domain-containing protein [Bacillus]EJT19472.1 hypothetical protein B353_18607 [Bacillus anthracis str. UR-1]EXJ20106.1 hypothetical protein Y693_14460 [Bacillus anthracis str. 95014]AAP26767.1 hypothetical protein BA_2945 [Bacillus anthracis str. Ames]AAT32061.1 hypothetical protein GBAA_2945 [Bacillus anthracis str. 'Ames Ancestor']AAT55044.1 hypothetical protein BAS2735 [Bacillus anthracis str. Sterne]
MIVYTVQTEEAWKQFKKLGYLEGNKEFIDSDDIYSYDWMVRVAKTKLPHYEGNYPIWVWEANNYPNRNHKAWGRKNSKMVILTLDVPKKWVLWSYFDYWCCAMTDGSTYLHTKNKCTLDEWYIYMDKKYGIIFNFDYLLSHPDWYLDKEDSLEKQGVIGKIPLSFVKKVRRFRAKEDTSIHTIRSDNWDNRKENRIKKMNRKLRKRNEKQKRVQKRLIRN